ncbi:MAG: hypothetical protein PHV63_04360 [Candidatus Daviesbacteria bacterium]|nr:hypothetical protein [Candidatus Daviesbacteria bacterium]
MEQERHHNPTTLHISLRRAISIIIKAVATDGSLKELTLHDGDFHLYFGPEKDPSKDTPPGAQK